MNVDNIKSQSISIEVTRYEEQNYSLVCINFYDDSMLFEAYKQCPLNVKSERDTQILLMNRLGFSNEVQAGLIHE